MQDPTLKFVINTLKQHKTLLCYCFLSLLSTGLGHAALLTLMGPFIQALTGQTSKLPMWASEFLPTVSMAWQIPFAMILAGSFKSMGSYCYQWLSSCLAIEITTAYRKKLFAGLLASHFEDVTKKSAGTWMSILMNDAQVLQKQVIESVSASVRDSMVILASWTTLLVLHPWSAITLLCVGPFLAYGMGHFGKRISGFSDQYQTIMSHLTAIFLDQRQRFDIIKAQQAEQNEKMRFQKKNDEHFRYVRKSILVRAAFAPLIEWVGFCLFALWIWGLKTSPATFASGQDLVLFFTALGSMLRPLKGLGEQYGKLQEVRGILQQGQTLLTQSPLQKPTHDHSYPLPQKIDSLHLKRPQFEMTLQDIHFQPKVIAVIGQSGSGKSTFARILASLVPPSQWESNIDWLDLCTQVTMVSQKPFLFNGSIYDNLIYGLPQPPSSEEIQKALWVVDMQTHIHSLTSGLNTQVNVLHTNFSGGQLQRLTLARGLLSTKPILIVDEITASLDMECEKTVITRLINQCRTKKRMLITITHRLSWLDQVDDVWWMKDGTIVSKGPHHDLQKNRQYCDFVQTVHRTPHLAATP